MAVKRFTFAVSEEIRGGASAEFSADAATLTAAFEQGAAALPPMFGAKQRGMRLFRFRFTNGRTGEASGFLGQGYDVREAWSDAVKGTYETFRPKNDGKPRPSVGVLVIIAGEPIHRDLRNFEGDETYAQERRRLEAEKEAARLAAGGQAA